MPEQHLTTRKMPVTITATPSAPSTLNEDTRSVDVVMTTEEPAQVYDWWEDAVIDEVLLMDGAHYDAQMPLLNTHNRYGVENVLGSVRDIRNEGEHLVGIVYFSATPEADSAWTKVREGHLTDFSIGYRVDDKGSVFIPEGTTAIVAGKTFTGPVRVTTSFTISELSICPIGADKLAKARAAAANINRKESAMNPDEKGRSPEAPAPLDAEQIRAAAVADAKRQMEEELATERKRSAELMAMGRKFECPELAEKAIADGTTVADFNGVVLDHVAKQREGQPLVGFRAEMGLADADKFRAAAQDAILLRSGRSGIEQNDLAGYTLREMARECLVRSGHRPPVNPMDMIGRALTTSDFPLVLANVANQSVLDGFEQAEETWSQWCSTGSTSDFKTNTLVRPGEFDDLDEIPENGEYKYGSRAEQSESYSIATYGKLFALSRQAIINDDLSVLTDIPAGHGEAAARKIGDLAYAVLTANSAMGDGTALFASGHANLAGSGGAVSVTTIGAGEKAMGLQKDIGGKRRLNIRPQFFLAPLAIKTVAETFFANTVVGTQAEPNVQNIYAGKFTRVYEARLDEASSTAWYLVGPKGKTVVLFFLNGVQTPYMETKDGWSVDGVEWKVRIDAGAKAKSWKALYKNAGA